MASFWYNSGLAGVMNGTIDLDTDDIRVALVNTNYTENKDHDFMDDVTAGAAELTATNYVRKALANESVAADNIADRAKFDADDVVWTALGGAANDTIHGAVVYKHVGASDAANPVILFIDLTNLATNGGDITMSFHADGIGYAASA